MPITVWVTAVTPDPSARAAGYPSSIAIGHGFTSTGDQVTFAGESRLLSDVSRQLAYGKDPVAVEIESWQVQTREPVAAQ